MTNESDGQGQGQGSFPWDRWLEGLPLYGGTGGQGGLPGAGIQEYVQELLKRSFAQANPQTTSAQAANVQASQAKATRLPQPEVFETHRSVIVRVKVPAGAERGRLRVVHDALQLRIEGLYDDRTLRVRLPALVYTGRSRSQIKDGILEIRLLKRRKPGREREIYVEY